MFWRNINKGRTHDEKENFCVLSDDLALHYYKEK